MKQFSPVGKALMEELKKIYDDRDFVVGCLSITKTEANWRTMLNFIEMARFIGVEITHDDMLKLAVILKNRSTD